MIENENENEPEKQESVVEPEPMPDDAPVDAAVAAAVAASVAAASMEDVEPGDEGAGLDTAEFLQRVMDVINAEAVSATARGVGTGKRSPLATIRVGGGRLVAGSAWRMFVPGQPPSHDASSEEKKPWWSVIGDMMARLKLSLGVGGQQRGPRGMLGGSVPGGGKEAPNPVVSQEHVEGAILRTLREHCPEDYGDRMKMIKREMDAAAARAAASGMPGITFGMNDICNLVAGVALGQIVPRGGESHAGEWEHWARGASGCGSGDDYWLAFVDLLTEVPAWQGRGAAPVSLISSIQICVAFRGEGSEGKLTPRLVGKIADAVIRGICKR